VFVFKKSAWYIVWVGAEAGIYELPETHQNFNPEAELEPRLQNTVFIQQFLSLRSKKKLLSTLMLLLFVLKMLASEPEPDRMKVFTLSRMEMLWL
jgi:hypothetical protein